jgi:hypothetical protein
MSLGSLQDFVFLYLIDYVMILETPILSREERVERVPGRDAPGIHHTLLFKTLSRSFTNCASSSSSFKI